MRRYTLAWLVCLSLWTPQSLAWGPTGHRVGAKLAEPLLSDNARTQVIAILGQESLAKASTWADEMRSNPSDYWQRQAGPLHYVTVPTGTRYGDKPPPAKGDAITALAPASSALRPSSASAANSDR